MVSNSILVMIILKLLKILSLLKKMEMQTQMTKTQVMRTQVMETVTKKRAHLNQFRLNLRLVTPLSLAKMSTKMSLHNLALSSQLSSLSENSKTIKSYWQLCLNRKQKNHLGWCKIQALECQTGPYFSSPSLSLCSLSSDSISTS